MRAPRCQRVQVAFGTGFSVRASTTIVTLTPLRARSDSASMNRFATRP